MFISLFPKTKDIYLLDYTVQLPKVRKVSLVILSNLRISFNFSQLSRWLNSFLPTPLTQNPIQDCSLTLRFIILSLLWSRMVPEPFISVFLMTFTFLKSIGHSFCRMSLNLGFRFFFLLFRSWSFIRNIQWYLYQSITSWNTHSVSLVSDFNFDKVYAHWVSPLKC